MSHWEDDDRRDHRRGGGGGGLGLMSRGEHVRDAVAEQPLDSRIAFMRKVYLLLFAGLAFTGAGVYVGAFTPAGATFARLMGGGFLFIIIWFGAAMAAQALVRVKGLGVPVLFAYNFFLGMVIAPAIAGILAIKGYEAGWAVIGNALGLTAFVFGGLTVYTLVSKKDFSYLGGILSIAAFGMIGVFFLGMFIPALSMSTMTFSILYVVILSGFILYETSLIRHRYRTDQPAAAALQLSVSVVLLFYYILMIFAGSRD